MTAKPCVQDVSFPECESSHVGRLRLQLNCNSDCVYVLRSIVAVMSARAGMSELRSNRVAVAVDELFANIANHAYGGKPGRVEFETRIINHSDGSVLLFDFRDYASVSWNGCLKEVAARRIDHANPCPGGLGLKLICSVSDHCEHDILDDGNRWRLIFKLAEGE
ncbi:MAG: ATP-binding protein [Zetaproteobacteria bacterium CG12_big_fil_rev_8_21_14_0_65_54_13]|nr:MAG: ATP-binding protein [Zetaproteobacteria bacterium CG23_combo_of_CG06-09_8_20_14_all_54_7]PIW50032.1 MAG: ATP-binding protein [Zetaproteobacteria bacterium CG12_big_fil_rev_8_21_14_0_65_54_13]PIX54657.1 MAG: ATP-binding protein [Zetaproteobacteria bacterium CG_4_10_14_3_um_filter_54_28]PJA30751.1 MAG: ATP-binding protein [Zetaproteobacteria bacterium CG_4_9_14_3_um_filter_54_145]